MRFPRDPVVTEGKKLRFQLTVINYFDKKYNILYEYMYIFLING